jgi:tetratricopeptide (TPR) repeat protein
MDISIKSKYSFVFFLTIALSHRSLAQETVFSIFKTNVEKADEYFHKKNYEKAIDLYKTTLKNEGDDEIYLRIARSYFYLNQPSEAVQWYGQVAEKDHALPVTDMYIYAEALCTVKQYDQAIEWYSRYQNKNPSDPVTIKKIWQLRNREFLYEDSSHYTVRPVDINTSSAEFGAVPYEDGLIFISNRKRKGGIRNTGSDKNPFYRVYLAESIHDTTRQDLVAYYSKPVLFCRELDARFHEGAIALYDRDKMLYTSTGALSKDKTRRTLQLHFAERKSGFWEITQPFPFNSNEYSITDPAMSKDQRTLYFSSDMKGGVGGKDLYKCDFVNGRWSKPVNLGEVINTAGDESSPFIDDDNILYFASNGHAGLGGLDIFKIPFTDISSGDVANLGYPVNTNADDFGIYLDKGGMHGYFTSNRAKGNDDIYELAIDMQTYPLVIKGVLKYKAESWKDSSELKIFPYAQLSLLDNQRNIAVGYTTTDSTGSFLLTIPYSSQYKIKVTDPRSSDEVLVGLELSKRKTAENIYEIVVVKNAFKNTIQSGLIK